MLLAVVVASQTAPAGAAAETSHGAALYARHRASCHGAAMQGVPEGPALADERFGRKWAGKSAFRLFEKIRLTMPQDDAGTLRPEDAAELTAEILAQNGIAPPTKAPR